MKAMTMFNNRTLFNKESWRIFKICMTAFVVMAVAIEASLSIGQVFFLGWKLSPSIHGHFFIVIRHATWRRGDLVAFIPSKTRYGEGTSWWMKYVMGVSGDDVVVQGNRIWVHGYDCGVMQDKAYDGQKLIWQKSRRIPPGFVFVWGTNPRSFDSRYQQVGLIHETSILGRGILVF